MEIDLSPFNQNLRDHLESGEVVAKREDSKLIFESRVVLGTVFYRPPKGPLQVLTQVDCQYPRTFSETVKPTEYGNGKEKETFIRGMKEELGMTFKNRNQFRFILHGFDIQTRLSRTLEVEVRRILFYYSIPSISKKQYKPSYSHQNDEGEILWFEWADIDSLDWKQRRYPEGTMIPDEIMSKIRGYRSNRL